MKTALITIIGIILIGTSIFMYKTRPMNIPTQDTTETTSTDSTIQTETAEQKTTTISDTTTLRIDESQSQVTFTLNETLNGKPVLVVGGTNNISGNIQLKTTNPAKLTIGTIKIDARTFKTDDDRRNGAIARMILKSDQQGNEYITFTATDINGIPATIESGKPFSYTITGNLTIRDTTKTAIFNATSTMNADGSLSGKANTIITYGDFGISVPNLSFIANVDKATTLSIELLAK
jgi:polyisoprenoid-binding protein YceI